MKDTPAEVQALHRQLLLERSGEERVRMAASMGRTARALVWASLPAELSEADRREQFFLRFYASDFSPEQRAEIVAHVRRCTEVRG
jgi:hypothetical protein